MKPGDKLSTIAQNELGSVRFVKQLIAANKDLIKDPNRLQVGWVLDLPNVN